MKLEIAVQDAAGARLARQVGADRIELCAALGATGGLTPSAGAIERGCAAGIEVHALVRARPGGYVYERADIETMVADVAIARSLGAAGVVVGALNAEGEIDAVAMRAFIEAADGGEVTFHRAFDVLVDPLAGLDQLVALGVTRVLTSGGAPRVGQGIGALGRLARHAAGRIQIQAGGGLRLDDVPAVAAAGVDAVHLSAKTTIASTPSGPGGGGEAREVTDAALAQAAVAAVRALEGAV